MAVYTKNDSGNITLVRNDLTQGTIETMLQTVQMASGVEVSSCIKDTLSMKSVITKKVNAYSEEL